MRKFTLIRVGPGDYLCPSNDRETIWRFMRYEDGKVWGLVCDFERRDFWRVLRRPASDFADGRPFDPSEVGEPPWFETERHLSTRKAALASVFGDES